MSDIIREVDEELRHERYMKLWERYGELAGQIEASIKSYAEEVRARKFPAAEHTYPLKPKA